MSVHPVLVLDEPAFDSILEPALLTNGRATPAFSTRTATR